MRAVQSGSVSGPSVGAVLLGGLLGVLARSVGLTGPGWVVGLTGGLVTVVALHRALVRAGAARLGPANRVTLVRAVLACGVAALTAQSFVAPTPLRVFVGLTVVALLLDAVDGRVARLTRTVSALGARFDMEVDAFLILVLSVHVARSAGAWVLAIGLARYVFVAAGWLLPWLRRPAPPRYWCKVVAAVAGVVLTAVAADVLPRSLGVILLVVTLALLGESFGRDVWWLWRHRPPRGAPLTSPASLAAAGSAADG